MIGVINPNATETFDTQLAFAHNATLEFAPGEYFPSEVRSSTSSRISSTTSSSSSSTSSTVLAVTTVTVPTTVAPTTVATNSPAVAASGGGSSGLSTGAIAGICVCVAVIAILAAILTYLFGRHRKANEILRHSQLQSEVAYFPPSGQMSPVSKSGYLGKVPAADTNSVSGGRYSALGAAGFYDGNPINENESHRSRSPPMDGRGNALSPLAFAAIGGTESPRWSATTEGEVGSPLRNEVPPPLK